MTDAGPGSRGELEAVALVLGFAPEVDAVGSPVDLAETDHVEEASEAVLRARGEQLDVPQVRYVAGRGRAAGGRPGRRVVQGGNEYTLPLCIH
jgi:hypothetical protein